MFSWDKEYVFEFALTVENFAVHIFEPCEEDKYNLVDWMCSFCFKPKALLRYSLSKNVEVSELNLQFIITKTKRSKKQTTFCHI